MLDVKVFNCKTEDCQKLFVDSSSASAVYFPSSDTKFKPVFFEDVLEVEDLVKKILEQLPEPRDINEEEFNVNY